MLAVITSPGRVSERTWLVIDAGIAAVLLAASVVEIVRTGADSGWGGPAPVAIVLAAVGCGALAVRSRYALGAAVVVTASAAVVVGLVAPAQGPFELFVALVLVFYAVGAHTPTRPAVIVLAVVLGADLVSGFAGVDGGAGNAVPAAVWLAAAWVAGRAVRSRTARARELEDLTSQLAAEREERARAAVTFERARIARELHDIVAHNVSVMVLHAQVGERTLVGDQPEAAEALRTIEKVGRQTVDELRRLLGILRRDDELALSPPPGLTHLDVLVQGVRRAGLQVDVTVEGQPAPVPQGVDVTAYRVVQEALTNTIKHARATRAAVTLRYRPDALELEVVDDGASSSHDGTIAGSVDGHGHGLLGMRERVLLYDGKLDVGARPDGGFVVHALLPITGGTA